MAAEICEISLADCVWKAQTHHHAECHQNRLFLCGDIAIFRIFKTAVVAILDIWNREILSAIGMQRVKTHQHAKFHQNRSISCKHIKILRFFEIVAAAILLTDCVWRAQTHNSTKFRQNWSFHCGDITNFRRRHLVFLKSHNFIGCWGPEGRDASACQILSKSVNRMWRY